jgi:hypothetical protein
MVRVLVQDPSPLLAADDHFVTGMGVLLNNVFLFENDNFLTGAIYSPISTPSQTASFSISLAEELTYMPANSFSGVDSFSYQLCSPSLVCDYAMVYIEVAPRRFHPFARDDAISIPANQPLLRPNIIYVLRNDNDVDGGIDPTNVVLLVSPKLGAVNLE